MALESLFKTYGKPRDVRALPPASVERYSRRAPPTLAALWKAYGTFSLGGGVLWFIDPMTAEAALEDFGPLLIEQGVSRKAFAFARSAFGHLYLWDSGHVWSFDPLVSAGSYPASKVTSDFDFFLNDLLTMPRLREKILREPLFEHARRKLGATGHDTVYTLNPLPPLGGTFGLDHLKVGKMREYLAIAAQTI
jgi:hypothetical protein